MAVSAWLLSTIGCMVLPGADFHLHDYGGDLEANPIVAVEDGRRITLVQVVVTKQKDTTPFTIFPEPMLLERSTATTIGASALPVWTSERQLRDQAFLKRCHEMMPLVRRPEKLDTMLGHEPGLLPWGDGFIVATRPFAVAYPATRRTFDAARKALVKGGLSTRPAFGPMSTSARDGVVRLASEQQANFRTTWVEPIALGQRVDVVQLVADTDTVRIVRLDTPISIDALLDLLATPGGIETHVAEEIRQPRTLPASFSDDAARYPNEFPRL